jgi:hypothetical protein
MPDSAVLTFTDPDAYHASIRGARVDGIVTSGGNFRVKWTGIQLDRLAMQRREETLPRVAHNAIDPGQYGILLATNPRQPPGYVRGLELSPADIIVYGVGSVGHNRSPAAEWGSMALMHEDIAAAGEALIGRELTARSFTQRIRPPAPLLSRLLNLHKANRVPSVPAFRKWRVQAATPTLTDVGGFRGAEGKPSRSQPAGVSRDLLAALSDERHGDPRKGVVDSTCDPADECGV